MAVHDQRWLLGGPDLVDTDGGGAPGKRTLTEARYGAIQMRARDGGDAGHGGPGGPGDRDGVATGPALGGLLGGGGAPLPAAVQTKMEDAFDFDFSSVRVHQGSEADALGARAFTHGSDVHFGAGEYRPDDRAGQELIGHELAHVVQQSQGRVGTTTQAKGLDVNADAGLEREADVAGAAAARGERVQMPGGGGGGRGAIQGKAIQLAAKSTHYGTFTDEKYDLTQNSLSIVLKFTPNDQVNASKIGLTQSLRSYAGGNNFQIDPSTTARTSGTGHFIDRVSDRNNPIYGAPSLGGNNGLDQTPQDNNSTNNPTQINPDQGQNASFQLGHRVRQGNTGNWDVKDAGLSDAPTLEGGNNSGKEFETAALAIEGGQAGTYLGSVKWGWKRNGTGQTSKIAFDVVSQGVPSKNFLGAAQAWNDGKARGHLVARANGTNFYDDHLNVLFTLDTTTELNQRSTIMHQGTIYQFVEVTSGGHAGQTGYVVSSQLRDKGDGSETVDLPMVQVKVTNADGPLYADRQQSRRVKSLPRGTRVREKSTYGQVSEVDIVDGPDTGQSGWVVTARLVAE